VIYRFALAAIVTGSFVFKNAAFDFVLVITMGIAVGVAIGALFYAMHRWLPTSTNIDVVLTFLSPYAMYIIAEQFHFSGVLAVVSGGLFLSARRHEFLSHQSRLRGINVWESVAFVLNGFVFILIGLEFPVIIKNLGPEGFESALKYSLIITGVLIVARFICTFSATFITMFMGRYITVADRNPGWKAPLILGWTGMRGVVSLAAALSIPVALKSGEAFPNRDIILFITFTVILVTLILQGSTLPLLIKWVKMPDPDLTISFEQQRQLVRKKLAHLSIKILEEDFQPHLKNNDMVKSLHLKYTTDFDILKDWENPDNEAKAYEFYKEYREVLSRLLEQQRALLLSLNKKDNVNDDIVKQQLELLDLEEEKLRQHFETEAK
ncbi:MAG: Na+/H+ antiporter, partial [Pedobacter sp.]